MADSIGNIYGNALFEVCCEENCLDEVYGELGSIRDILFSQGQEEYVELLASPLVTENEKRAALEKVDKSLMGGIVLRYSDTEIDGSVRTKLDDIKAQIDGVIA